MGKAVIYDIFYPTTELVHEGSCTFFLMESSIAFFPTITG